MSTHPSDSFLIQGLAASFKGRLKKSRSLLQRVLKFETGNQQALFLLVKIDHLNLFRESGYSSLQRIVTQLSGPAKAVVEAWKASQEGDWQSVAGLDEMMSQSRPSDLWYDQAMILRTSWRNQYSDSKNDAAYSAEAIELLQTIPPNHLGAQLLLIRMDAGLNANRPIVFVGAAEIMAATLEAQLRMPLNAPRRKQIRDRLDIINEGLHQIQKNDSTEIEEIRLQQFTRRMESIARQL